jgi:hypothetical protein
VLRRTTESPAVARLRLRAGKYLQPVDQAVDFIVHRALEGEDLSKDKDYIQPQ